METESLGDALPKEIARVRDDVLPLYIKLGSIGAFGAKMIRKDLDDASRAMISGDVIEMIRVYKALQETN